MTRTKVMEDISSESSKHEKSDTNIFSIDRLLLPDVCETEFKSEGGSNEHIERNSPKIVKPLPIKKIMQG